MKSVPRLTWYADVELRIHGYQHEREVPHAVQRHQDGLPAVTHLVRQPQGYCSLRRPADGSPQLFFLHFSPATLTP